MTIDPSPAGDPERPERAAELAKLDEAEQAALALVARLAERRAVLLGLDVIPETSPPTPVITAAVIVHPGDVIVVGTSSEWSSEQIATGREMWESLATGAKLMILPGVTSMAVVRADEAP